MQGPPAAPSASTSPSTHHAYGSRSGESFALTRSYCSSTTRGALRGKRYSSQDVPLVPPPPKSSHFVFMRPVQREHESRNKAMEGLTQKPLLHRGRRHAQNNTTRGFVAETFMADGHRYHHSTCTLPITQCSPHPSGLSHSTKGVYKKELSLAEAKWHHAPSNALAGFSPALSPAARTAPPLNRPAAAKK